MQHIMMFIAFLAAFACWAFFVRRAGQMMSHIPMSGFPFWSTEMMLLPGLAGFLAFIYFLSGFWSWKLAVIMLLALHLGPLLAWFLTNAFGKNAARATSRTFWIGMEIGSQMPRLIQRVNQLVGFLVISYPFVAAFISFRHPWGSLVLEEQEIKCTLLLITVNSYLLMAIILPKMLASENLDDDTRQNAFFMQLASLVPTAAYGALGAAAFGLDQNSMQFQWFGATNRIASFGLLVVLFAFFAGTALIPYLVGAQRSRVKELGFLDQIKLMVADIEDSLETPQGAAHVTKLDDLRTRIATVSQQLLGREGILNYYNTLRLDLSKADENQKRLVEAIDNTGDLDGRFRFLNELRRLQIELGEIIANLQPRDPADANDAAAKWAKRYENRKAELKQKIDDLSSHKPVVAAGLGSGLMIIISGILGEVAKAAWSLLSHGH